MIDDYKFERFTRQCVHIWSDNLLAYVQPYNLQLPYNSQLDWFDKQLEGPTYRGGLQIIKMEI